MLRTLRSIDWDFAGPRRGYVPPLHWYPGTFIPQLSDALVEALCPVGGVVFDPYGGIGTSGWSALRTGRSCYLADVNPIALLTSFVTTSLLVLGASDHARASAAIGILENAVGTEKDLFGHEQLEQTFDCLSALVRSCCNPPSDKILEVISPGVPSWHLLEPWIEQETLGKIRRLFDRISSLGNDYTRVVGLCMISANLRLLSSQHASWGHIADNVIPKQLVSRDLHISSIRWLRRAKAFIEQGRASRYVFSANALRSNILHVDWSTPPTACTPVADLLLSSPPYADAIDYTLAHRLSLYLFGYDESGVGSLVLGEIGARRKRFKSDSRRNWSEQLCNALRCQADWVKPNGVIALILPHKESGRQTGEDDIKHTLDSTGWALEFQEDRSIHQSHTRQSWTSIKRETVLIFSRR